MFDNHSSGGYQWIQCSRLEWKVQSSFRGGFRGGGAWAMAGVQGKVAFGLSHFCIEVFQKKVLGLQIPMKIPT